MKHRRFVRAAAPALLAALALGFAPSQNDVEKEVIAAGQRLFDAMAAKDTMAMKKLLTANGYLHAMRVNGETTRLRSSTHQEFITAIGGSQGRLLERMWEPKVLVRGPVAMLWALYDFHRDETFSHCGVDVITLVKVEGEWRISGVTYTSETQACPSNPSGPPRKEPGPRG